MSVVAFDTETWNFRAGLKAPPVVCVSWAPSGLTHWSDAEPLVRGWLTSPNLLIGHNVAYDAAALCAAFPQHTGLWFDKYDRQEVGCTLLLAQLHDIANGCFRGYYDTAGVWHEYGYGLQDLVQRFFGRRLDKHTWRQGYRDLHDKPLEAWPYGAKAYAIQDAVEARNIYEHLGECPDWRRQTKYAFALQLASVWGLRTSHDRVDKLIQETIAARSKIEPLLRDQRLIRSSGSKNVKAIRLRVQEAGGTKKTATGRLSIDAKTCNELDDPVLRQYATWSKLGSIINKDAPLLRSGVTYPIHTSFGLAASGRVTSSKPNCQNFGRKGDIRSCFVPRPGYLFSVVDYPQLELRTVAQVLLDIVGWSKLAEALNAGIDPHLKVAALLANVSYETALTRYEVDEPEIVELRQLAKVANFGYPGGMSPKTLVAFAIGYGVTITLEQATRVRDVWLETYPEFREYFWHVNSLWNGKKRKYDVVVDGATERRSIKLYDVTQLYSLRVRRDITYTEACNTYFQGLGADCAKHATWLVQRACYARPYSPLYGSRIVMTVHDELVLEVPEVHAVLAANEQSRLMTLGANKLLTKVPVQTTPILMRAYGKYSKPKLDEKGCLVPW